MNLAWRNTFGGGAPTSLYLEAQSGPNTRFFPLGATDTFAAPGVPAGSYTLRLWALNAGGPSGLSNQIVVSNPCGSSPATPMQTVTVP